MEGAPLREQSVSPIVNRSRQLFFGQEFGHGLGLGTDETAGEVLGQERVGFCAGDSSLGVLVMFVCRAGESDQRGGKFHLRIVSILGGAAQGESLLDQGIAIEARGGILFLLRNTHPRLTDPLSSRGSVTPQAVTA